MAELVKWSAAKIKAQKGREKIACLTAYDYFTARLVDEAGIPLVLVGDSLGMTMLGYESTLPVTLEQMLHHGAAVSRAVKSALVVGDMPFMSYQVSREQALENAGRFLKEGGVGAVKLEGGALRAETIAALVRNGIPVLGHIGLTPQSLRELGGYKVQGRRPEEAKRLLADAQALEQAGVFALVVECVPAELGAELTAAVKVPTIGIGAGPACDGQILVSHDLFGMTPAEATPKFVKRYAEVGAAMRGALAAYHEDVRAGRFPADAQSYS
ncbi:MAG: 3-methyl-2-oxobutanoate hydroxymethyltransferase [Kiritimatiellia bacterium]